MIKIVVTIPLALSLFCTAIAQKPDVKTLFPLPEKKINTDSLKNAQKKQSFSDKIKSSKKIDGLFVLYQDTTSGNLQLYVKKEQLNKEFIYQSFSISGPTQLFLNQSMHRANFAFTVKQAFDKLEFLELNTSFYYDKNNAISKTAMVDKPEAVIYSDKFTEDSAGYLISADGLFISEKLDPIKPNIPQGSFSFPTFNLGNLNPYKSKYFNVRSFPDNTDVVVDLAYDNSNSAVPGNVDITDNRYVRVRMQHSFIAMPDNDFKPRKDDPRIGYFMEQRNDQTSTSVTPYKDMINRWNLKKKDSTSFLSEPTEPIIWWIENTTPIEYRQTIIDAGLKWNDAFEKAGFKNVVQMKIMPDTATWDPADIHYNVIRWVSSSTPSYGAIGPSFTNPKTPG